MKEADFKYKSSVSKRVDHRDFLVCRGNGNPRLVGLGFFPERDLPDVVFPDTMIAIRVDTGHIDRKYLEFVWRSKGVRGQIEAGARTTNGTFKINQGVVMGIRIPVPPIEEQRRVAAILDQADRLKAHRRRAVSLLDDLTQSIFLDMFGDPATNPRHWEWSQLSDLGEVQGGLQVTFKRYQKFIEIPYLRVANVYRNSLNLDEIKSIKVSELELERTRLRGGDLLVVEGHGNPSEIGRVAVWNGSIDPCVHQNHLIRIRIGDQALPVYMSAFLNSPGGRQHLLRSASTTSGLNTISTSDVRSTPVMLPPLKDQIMYAEKIEHVRQLRVNQMSYLRCLDELFVSLQHEAFRNEL
jgi:type I restriction enzyme S subunit